MANALGTLFGDIAEAIREKTGDTAKMKPAEFPSKISGIEVGGGGSGGGDLPAGIYLTAPDEPAPCTYRYQRFKYNGELYAGSAPYTSAGSLQTIYKWNGSTWDTILDKTVLSTIVGSKLDSVNWRMVEYNGKAHFIQGKYHFVFDGTTFAESTHFSSGTGYPVIYNGKLYAINSNDKIMYEWNETNSSWVAGNTLTGFNGSPFVVDGTLYYRYYASSKRKLYKYENGNCTEVGPVTGSAESFSFGGNFYSLSSASTGDKVYKLNIKTGEETYVGYLPPYSLRWFSQNTEDVEFAQLSHSTTSCCPYFVIRSVVEPTE